MMVKKLRFLVLGLLCFLHVSTYAQVGQGGIKGKVIDKETNEPVPFANVVVESNGKQVLGGTTDFDGVFFLKPLAPGEYDIKATYVGYQAVGISGVVVRGDKTTFQDLKMSQGVELEVFEFVEYDVPLINKDGGSDETFTKEQIAKMPGRSANDVAIMAGGIYSEDGERGNVRGSRETSTDTYIDGVRVRGSSAIPNSAIEQVQVITGGLPAQYGDATGGVISITTKGATSQYFGSVEGFSSRLTDQFNDNLLGVTLSGPLLFKKDKENPENKKPLLSFLLSTEFTYTEDPRPSAIGNWKVRDDVLDQINANPLRRDGEATLPNAEFLRASDFERTAIRPNTSRRGALIQGKIDVSTTDNTSLTFGGTFDYNQANNFLYANQFFNTQNNPLVTNQTARVYARFTQRFGSSEESDASVFQNAYYTIQADYTNVKQVVESEAHRDNFFNYGHYGRFTSTFVPNYQFGRDSVTGLEGYIQDNFRQVSYDFEPGPHNPILSQYNVDYYSLFENPEGFYENPNQVAQGGGLLNGRYPRNLNAADNNHGHIYNLANAPGTPFNGYQRFDQEQFRIRATGSADIKNHNILIGFEFEQRVDRGFFVDNPVGLWQVMRQLANRHISELDFANPIVTSDGTFPTISYNRLNTAPGPYQGGSTQSFFDYNSRIAAGLDPHGLDFLDTDAFDPGMYDLSFFNADEVLNNGNRLVSYYGYDHTGQRLRGRTSFDDFFTERDEFGNFRRNIDAFRPIYMAGYIQDKFTFDDLVFNVGVRIDRFDANQQVLKDEFSLFNTVSAGEVDYSGADASRPANIGDDYVVYVGDIENPSANNIVGYRNGSTWFNAQGVEITNPVVLETPSGIAPWLQNPDRRTASTDLTSESFENYTPQINVMPRVSFSFPISDEALFYAHYDVLIERPETGLRLDPAEYMFLESVNRFINNPNLKPQQTIDYEVGFQQKLNANSSLKISAFYREMRNMVQRFQKIGAFPRTYTTFENLDFGTVKGLTLRYDLRRVGNLRMFATYTLQFADATGSGASTGVNLINIGFPNLRNYAPLDFDQRHNFTINADYRYGSGKNYNGPVINDKQILANTGLNITAQGGSGKPYSGQSNITPEALTVNFRRVLEGGFNGSRYPFQFRVNARLDRDVNLRIGKIEEKKKDVAMNVYIEVFNLLNAQNIINVYRATGSPYDDGYLEAPEFLPEISSATNEESYREMYLMKLQDPRNFSLPRRIRLGAIFSF